MWYEIQENWKTIVAVISVFLVLFIGGGLWRVSQGEPWFKQESIEEREDRLNRCREVYNTTPSAWQAMSGEDAGVCSGFTEAEINR
jgi:hypothetical protein